MQTIDIHDLPPRVLELVESLSRTGDIVITRDEQPVARLSREDERPSLRALKPVSLGAPLRPLTRDEDLLNEMLRS